MSLHTKLESILFLTTKPLGERTLAKMVDASPEDTRMALADLTIHYNEGKRGIRLIALEGMYQMTTAPEHATLVADMIEDEIRGTLTQPQLETLTVVAYRGPMPKHEIELIRGVNCTLILRNLMMRGLVSSSEDATTKQTIYAVTMDFLRSIGASSVQELPDYATLHDAETLHRLLEHHADGATA